MSRIWPLVEAGRPWGLLVALPVRKQRHNSLRSAPLPWMKQRQVDGFVGHPHLLGVTVFVDEPARNLHR